MEKNIMYEKIYSDMLLKIKNSQYKEGDRLPSEKELEIAYSVSRITCQKAMTLLADQNLIERTRGRGSFVKYGALKSIAKKNNEIFFTENQKDNGRKSIGVIFDTFGNDFGSELLKGIELKCHEQDITMVFGCTYGSVDEENRAINRALAAGVSGLILMCAQGENYNDTIIKLKFENFPVVLVDRQMRGLSIPCVKTDNYSAGKELTELLVKHGNKDICFVTHKNIGTSTIDDRYAGFVDALVEHGNSIRGEFIQLENYNTTPINSYKEYQNYDSSEIERIIKKRTNCTAFLLAEYKMGVLFSRFFRENDLQKEIATFDGLSPEYDDKHNFSHIKQNEFLMGAEAVNAILKEIDGEEITNVINVPYEIIDLTRNDM